jgi:hypothetical protein
MRIEWDLEARWNKQKPFLLFAVFVNLVEGYRKINTNR